MGTKKRVYTKNDKNNLDMKQLEIDSAALEYVEGFIDHTSEVKHTSSEVYEYAKTDFKAGANWALDNLENDVYVAIISECESLEQQKVGNGHHLAQRLTKLITDKIKQ